MSQEGLVLDTLQQCMSAFWDDDLAEPLTKDAALQCSSLPGPKIAG